MELATNVQAQLQSLPLKSQVFDIPDDVNSFQLLIKRATDADPSKFPDANCHIGVYAFISLDSVNWEFLYGFTTTGGKFSSKGVEEKEVGVPVIFSPGNGKDVLPDFYYGKPNRKIKYSFVTLEGTPPELFFDLVTLK